MVGWGYMFIYFSNLIADDHFHHLRGTISTNGTRYSPEAARSRAKEARQSRMWKKNEVEKKWKVDEEKEEKKQRQKTFDQTLA